MKSIGEDTSRLSGVRICLMMLAKLPLCLLKEKSLFYGRIVLSYRFLFHLVRTGERIKISDTISPVYYYRIRFVLAHDTTPILS